MRGLWHKKKVESPVGCKSWWGQRTVEWSIKGSEQKGGYRKVRERLKIEGMEEVSANNMCLTPNLSWSCTIYFCFLILYHCYEH